MNRDIPEAIKKLVENVNINLKNIECLICSEKPIPIEKLKNWVRESYQDIYREPMKLIISKLQINEELSEEEINLVEK